MRTEDLKAYQDFERNLRDYPVKRMMFWAQHIPEEDRDYQYAEQKAICEHLGIEFREEDFAVDEIAEAKAFVSQFPDMD